MNKELSDIMKSGKPFQLNDPAFQEVVDWKDRTLGLIAQLNTSKDVDEFRDRLSDIIGSEVDKSTTIFAPLHTNFGRHIIIGKTASSIMHAHSWIWVALLLKTMFSSDLK